MAERNLQIGLIKVFIYYGHTGKQTSVRESGYQMVR